MQKKKAATSRMCRFLCFDNKSRTQHTRSTGVHLRWLIYCDDWIGNVVYSKSIHTCLLAGTTSWMTSNVQFPTICFRRIKNRFTIDNQIARSDKEKLLHYSVRMTWLRACHSFGARNQSKCNLERLTRARANSYHTQFRIEYKIRARIFSFTSI